MRLSSSLYGVATMQRCCLIAIVGLTLTFVAEVSAQDRKTKVLNDRDTFAKNDVWLYNDLDAAFAEAKRSGKLLLVVFRCIPCEACSHFDKQLLDEQDHLRDLLDQFVCVRVVKANGLDLNLFQFDYDQSFHAMFFNADRTIYGRYGTRSQHKEDDDMTLAGFRKAMEAVLKLHQGYPKNKASLKSKSGGKVAFEAPEDMPGMKGKYTSRLDYEGNVVQSCIHCHQIRDAERVNYRNEGKELPEKVLYPYPLPSVIGLTMDPGECATIMVVEKGSIADKAGLQAGDRLLELGTSGPLISTADIQWVLHNAPSEAKLTAKYQRGDSSRSAVLTLPSGWRTKSDLAWRPTTWDLRRMALGGLWLKDLTDDERAQRSLDNESMALWVKHLGQFGEHAVAKNAGFQKDDVIVVAGTATQRWSETELIAAALKQKRGEKLDLTVLRGKERVELKLPLQ
jgi:hypothetical protein